jgi:tetratricopeptide (TPR) repeat protein
MPARNSDLWLHLASGRLLAGGQAPWGTEPFSSTASTVFWVNHTWLSDLVLFSLFAFGGGGKALVVAKALLVAALAGMFFCFRRRGDRLGVPAFAAVAALLAIGPWVLLQPVLLSLLGVVLTLFLLERPGLVEPERALRAQKQRWLLVPLFALWANLDAWFLLGPFLVGLYALGELPRSHRELARLLLLALAGLTACLLTPYHYRIFAWPVGLGLSHAEQVLMGDALGRGLVVSPFGSRFAASSHFASPGAWAYYLLLAAGLASFLLRSRVGSAQSLALRACVVGRLLVWLALAGLSAYQARCIPFFAVVAAPILTLNLQEWLRTVPVSGPLLRLQVAVRGVGALLGTGLLVLAWPGWLQPAPYQPRGWAVVPDESLVRLAHTLETWHLAGKLRPDHFALTFSPEASQHLAWFCPAEKGFLDSRLPLFDAVADDFLRMRHCILEPAETGPAPELGPLLDRYRVDRIIVHDSSWDRTVQAYRCLLESGAWELLALEGSAALFGRQSGRETASPWKAFDARQAAYRPESEQRAPLAGPRAPEPPGPFDAFYRARLDRSADREEAALHLMAFDLSSGRAGAELGRQWLLAHALGLLAAGSSKQPIALAVRLSLLPSDSPSAGQQAAGELAAGFLARQDRGSPEALLLAIRAARRAVAEHPDDARAFLLLGEAYLRLARLTREQSWASLLPPLADVRRCQAVSALEQAVLLRPDLDQAHGLLAQLYRESGQLDHALEHLRARLRIAAQELEQRGSGGEDAAERREALAAAVEGLQALVQRSLNIYEANSPSRDDPAKVLDRARLAARHGLTKMALDLLLESHPAIFGKAGAKLQLELMLLAGRAFEVRAVLRDSPHFWLRAQAAAACGDYSEADADLEQVSEERRRIPYTKDLVLPVRLAMAVRVAGAVLVRPVQGSGPAGLASALFLQFDALLPLPRTAGLLREEADLRVLRGILAVEAGDIEAARKHLRAALEVHGSSGAPSAANVDFLARPIAEEMLRRLEEKTRRPNDQGT